LALAWVGFHAPAAAPELLGAATAVVAWAVIADGPLGITRLIGLPVHRRGLLLIAAGVALVPFLSSRAGDLVVLVPCLAAGAGLLRFGLVRWPAFPDPTPTDQPAPGPGPPSPGPTSPATPDPTTPSPAPTSPARTDPAPPGPAPGTPATPHNATPPSASLGRRIGRTAGRAGTIAGRQAEVALPRGARVAGRIVGRHRRPTRDTTDPGLTPGQG
jgi:hypothetical protein